MSATDDPEALRLKLWETMEDIRVGMLGANPPHHMQPMTGYPEQETQAIYFFTSDDTDLVKDLHGDAPGHFVVISRDHKLRACLQGRLTLTADRSRIDKYWGPVAAAWFPKGKDDPHLTLLRFDVASADVWLSEAGPVKFAYEIAKANLTGDLPDLGARARIETGA